LFLISHLQKDLNDKFSTLPSMDDLSQFVTWPGLEDALNGVKKDWESLQAPERVVIEMSSQTEPVCNDVPCIVCQKSL